MEITKEALIERGFAAKTDNDFILDRDNANHDDLFQDISMVYNELSGIVTLRTYEGVYYGIGSLRKVESLFEIDLLVSLFIRQ